MYDRTEQQLEQELEQESNAAWNVIIRELVGKEFYDARTGSRHTIVGVEAVHGRYRIGRTYLVRDNEGRLCEVIPAPLEMSDGAPYTVLDHDNLNAVAPR